MNMIIEALEGCTISKSPGHRMQAFEELVPLSCESAESTEIADASTEGALYCGRPEQIRALREKRPDAWAFCICPADSTEPSFEEVPDKTIVCHSDLPFEVTSGRLARLFSAIGSWTQKMKALILEDGSYQGLLNISEPILKNFISISDSQFRLLAYTPNIEIDDPVTLRILELGYHPQETIDVFRQHGIMRDWETQTRVESRRAVFTKYPTADYVFRMQGNYYLHVVVQCNNKEATPAYLDAFQLLVDHIGYCVKHEFSQKFMLTNEPSTFFADLITRRATTDQQIRKGMGSANIPITDAYRLVGFNFDQRQGATSFLNYYAQHVKDTFPNTFVGTFNQTVLLLDPYANDATGHNARLLSFLNSHPCILGVSQVFSDMKDFFFAYQEVMAAIEISTSDFPVLAQYYEQGGSPVNFFDDLLPIYVASEAKANNALIEHIANTGTLAQIARYDEQHNSNDLHILYWYLANDRKVKPTCDRLFIHRNTLMYRIAHMQKRFGFDLDNRHTRMRLMMEFLLREH